MSCIDCEDGERRPESQKNIVALVTPMSCAAIFTASVLATLRFRIMSSMNSAGVIIGCVFRLYLGLWLASILAS